ncbi:MAG TPA: hypothetical protein DDW20_04750 [Firmicutes bacterium]|nr:hypothetical protein [Bacillota bacterium]
MENLNEIVASNLTELRKKSGLTQQQLAQQINYSDKTISKWELGQAIPSVDVLKDIADYYGVTIDYLITPNDKVAEINTKKSRNKLYNKIIMILLVNIVIVLIATVVFVWSCISYTNGVTILDHQIFPYWQGFVWATSLCFLVSFVLVRRQWRKNRIAQMILSSFFVWTIITSFYLQFLSQNVWYIYFVGIPVQIGIILLSNMR